MCGEHLVRLVVSEQPKGSSPHVRGARFTERVLNTWRGIIPACAGSTCGVRCVMPDRRDHPRMCGEHP